MSAILEPDKNFDVILRRLTIGERDAALIFIDGFIKDEVFEKILEFLYKIKPDELSSIHNMEQFSLVKMPYVEVDYEYDTNAAITGVLSGQAVIIIDKIVGALLIDTRSYPARAIEEPEKDRSIRGSRDGFVETFVFNTAMIRRRIRNPALRMEHLCVGSSSKVDVAISYIDGLADKSTVDKLRSKLRSIEISGISMTVQALNELLVPTFFLNPFPKVRFTERPDFASACLLEGKILLVMDNSPSVLIFPNSFFDFFKETDDYYFPPLSSTYVRFIRNFVSILTVFLTPTMLLFLNHPDRLPGWLEFINTKSEYLIPFYMQFLLLELLIDGLRLASLNTPDTLSNSLGIIGGLILGEFAVEAEWFVPESIIYMSFVALASYAQPNFEMGYALKFSRIFLLTLCQLFDLWGILAGTALLLFTLLTSKTLSGRKYFYPVIPFNAKEFLKIFVRTKIKNKKGSH